MRRHCSVTDRKIKYTRHLGLYLVWDWHSEQIGEVVGVVSHSEGSFHIKDRVAADAEEAARRTSPAAVTWDFSIGDHAMFCLITPEIAVLIERVMSLESTIRGQWSALPVWPVRTTSSR